MQMGQSARRISTMSTGTEIVGSSIAGIMAAGGKSAKSHLVGRKMGCWEV